MGCGSITDTNDVCGETFTCAVCRSQDALIDAREALRDAIGWMEMVDGQNNEWRRSLDRMKAALSSLEALI